MGAVDTLLLSEDLVAIHKVLKCPACGETKELTVKNEAEHSKADYRCEKCNESLKEESSLDLIDDFVEKAEEMDTTVEFISSETEEGVQLLRAFGGIAAILRYHLG